MIRPDTARMSPRARIFDGIRYHSHQTFRKESMNASKQKTNDLLFGKNFNFRISKKKIDAFKALRISDQFLISVFLIKINPI